MNFTGKALRLSDADLPRIGYSIGVGEDEIHAVLEVEASGRGYDSQGRPKMLFEPHIFYRNLSGAKQSAAIAGGLAYPHWGEKPYPADSYPRLVQAILIDETAALKSASWGLGQIMGGNFVAAGYDTVQAMVQGFVDLGEAEQLAAMVRFVSYNHLDDELRSHNWAGFARGYNGPEYAKSGYDTKLVAAFKKWSTIRDTPWPAPATETLREALNAPVVTPATPAEVRPVVPAPAPPIVVASAAAPAVPSWLNRLIASMKG